jgi:putative two-component system response regulator
MDENEKPRILIVDDTPANITVLMETLKGDYAIVAATSGKKALALATTRPYPDIILLDINMPEMDGYEVCARLKQDVRTKRVPVIFVTALAEEEDEARGLDLGAVDYITKPFRPGIVKARVRNQLALKKYGDDLQALVDKQVEEIADAHLATILAMSKLAESRDDDTGKHLERTQIYCCMLAQHCFDTHQFPDIIDERFIECVFHASPLHDIGKVAIPDAVLCKPGKLTDEEFDLMKTHTLRGAETLATLVDRYPNNTFINLGLEIARSHHEKWSGTGYPDGLSGDDIPLSARIMAVADVYDALTSERCYKSAFSHEKAREIILGDSGTHFDPQLCKAFEHLESEFDRIRGEMQT